MGDVVENKDVWGGLKGSFQGHLGAGEDAWMWEGESV